MRKKYKILRMLCLFVILVAVTNYFIRKIMPSYTLHKTINQIEKSKEENKLKERRFAKSEMLLKVLKERDLKKSLDILQLEDTKTFCWSIFMDKYTLKTNLSKYGNVFVAYYFDKYTHKDSQGNIIGYNWSAISDIMKKDKNEITDVQYIALSKVILSMIKNINGETKLDTENIKKFLKEIYIQWCMYIRTKEYSRNDFYKKYILQSC